MLMCFLGSLLQCTKAEGSNKTNEKGSTTNQRFGMTNTHEGPAASDQKTINMSYLPEGILKTANFRINTKSNRDPNQSGRDEVFCCPTFVAALWVVDVLGDLVYLVGSRG